MIYLDNAATTALHPTVLEEMMPFFEQHHANPSSVHSLGQVSKNAIESAREKVASLLGCSSSEIVFTSSGTESINMAIKGVFFEMIKKERYHIVSSHLEHSATLDTLSKLKSDFDAQVSYIDHNLDGSLKLDDLVNRIRYNETALISMMHVNNEIGNINDILRVVDVAKKNKIYVHCDGVQSVGKIPVDLREMNVDLFSLSGHKFHAPKGVGVLYCKEGVPLTPMIQGGSHEAGRRAGTENVAFIVGFAKALELAYEQIMFNANKVRELSTKFLNRLKSLKLNFSINGDRKNRIPYVLSITFHDIANDVGNDIFLLSLDSEGIASSNGSACSSGVEKISHVLSSLKISESLYNKTIRFSFSSQNTLDEIEDAANKIKKVVMRLSAT